MLTAGKTTRAKFEVDVHGTKDSVDPKVRVVFNFPTGEHGFPAKKEDGKWVADIAVPENVPAGEYDIRVEVVVNGRHFTPLKRRMHIEGGAQQPRPTHKDPEPPAAAVPPPKMEEKPVPAPAPTPKIPSSTLAKEIENFKLKETKKPVKKVVPSKSIFELADEKENKKPAKKLAESKPQIKISSGGTPVTLKKGGIIYE